MQKSRIAVWSMVLGIVGLCTSILPLVGLCLSPTLGIAALITGLIALAKTKPPDGPIANRGQAMVGTVLGALALVFGLLVGLGVLLVFRTSVRNWVDQSWHDTSVPPPPANPNTP